MFVYLQRFNNQLLGPPGSSPRSNILQKRLTESTATLTTMTAPLPCSANKCRLGIRKFPRWFRKSAARCTVHPRGAPEKENAERVISGNGRTLGRGFAWIPPRRAVAWRHAGGAYIPVGVTDASPRVGDHVGGRSMGNCSSSLRSCSPTLAGAAIAYSRRGRPIW